MRRALTASFLPNVVLTITLGAFSPGFAVAAPNQAPVAATRFSLEMSLIERSGATFADRNVDAALGVTETTTVQRKSRTVTIDTTVTAGNKPGCYKIAVVLRDRTINPTGHFNKTEWQSSTEPCDTQPVTLGPKEEIRLRIAVKPAG